MKKKLTPAKRTRCPTPTTEVVVLPKATLPSKALVKSFAEVIGLIQQARQRAFQTVNTALKWSSRELERQLAGALFERTVLSPPKVAAVLRQLHP